MIISNDDIKLLSKYDKKLKDLADKIEKIADVIETYEKNVGKSKSLKELNTNTKKISESQKDLVTSSEEIAKIEKQIARETARSSKEYIAKKAELDKTRRANRELVKSYGQEEGTLASLKRRNKELRQERDQLNLSTDEGRKRLSAINKELDKNNDELKENSDALAKQKNNVGNYASALEDIPGPLGQAAAGMKALLTQTLKFLATPIGVVIAALSAAFFTIKDALTGTQEGIEAVRKESAKASTIFNKLRDSVRDTTLELIGLKEEGESSEKSLSFLDKTLLSLSAYFTGAGLDGIAEYTFSLFSLGKQAEELEEQLISVEKAESD